jgi:hypothetical protein
MLYPTEVMAAVENTKRMDTLLESQQQPEELASEEGGVSQEALPVSEQEPESAEENSSEENAEPMVSPNPSESAAGANLYDRQPFVIDESDNYDAENDSVLVVVTADDAPAEFNGKRVFNPDPTRAVWMSVLCPGLGQIYNRRYWKLPIVVGGFVGLGYATAWNNNQLRDYTQGYRDLTDSDPATDSYMNFFPPNAQESDFDRTWLANTLKSRKDYYRRNRDLCIIGLVAVTIGLYFVTDMAPAFTEAAHEVYAATQDAAARVPEGNYAGALDFASSLFGWVIYKCVNNLQWIGMGLLSLLTIGMVACATTHLACIVSSVMSVSLLVIVVGGIIPSTPQT